MFFDPQVKLQLQTTQINSDAFQYTFQIQRLEEDTVMLTEVQKEINHLISEFSSLVTEEEERIVNKARILEKHNSCTEFKQVSYVRAKSDQSPDEELSEDEDTPEDTMALPLEDEEE
ncbi:Uncharacterized protein FKW44_016972 [Caligus rogercresseyi]|uniref:Uncharacterized protein n=1 Tax=Caligus rogercresseyi TaxID=217165 RepID=A0A7T8H2I1_CALRO|nr:Uncharacterized protein FKW44_016972 [Caligus rogercresseyi]